MLEQGRVHVYNSAIYLQDGEIVHVRDYMDGLGVAHAMGRLPAVAAALDRPA